MLEPLTKAAIESQLMSLFFNLYASWADAASGYGLRTNILQVHHMCEFRVDGKPNVIYATFTQKLFQLRILTGNHGLPWQIAMVLVQYCSTKAPLHLITFAVAEYNYIPHPMMPT